MNSKRFLVTLTGDASTRWIDGDEKIQAGLEMLVRTFARSYTSGAVPAARVELLPESKGPGTAAGTAIGCPVGNPPAAAALAKGPP